MDLGGTTKTATAATPESTVVVEKSCPVAEVTEKPAAASGKNGSLPDSSADSVKDSACAADSSPGKTNEAPKELPTPPTPPKKASDDADAVAKAGETNSIADATKSPAKQPAVPKSTDSGGPVKTAVGPPPCADQMDDNEDDELLKRMEAIEKGVDLDAVKEVAHQNGMPEKRMEVSQPQRDAGKVNDSAKPAAASSSEVSSAAQPSALKMDAADSAVAADPVSKVAETVSPNTKRKLALGEEAAGNEPQMKKVHVVADATDGPESSVAKPSAERQDAPAKQPSEMSTEPPGPSEPKEKPPSVEQMEVDEASSSPKDVELLPDTEPNTESDPMDEKSEEISSSVAEEPVRQEGDSTANKNKAEHSNVSSSDDKGAGGATTTTTTTSDTPKPAESSEVSASVLPTPSGDEAMEVDEDENDIAESSTSADPSATDAVPVVEPPCVKKVAYLCGEDEEPKESGVDGKDCVVSTEKPTAATSAATSSTLAASTSGAAAPMEVVDSGAKASSSSVADSKPVTDVEEDVVDSSNVATTASEEEEKVVVKRTETPTAASVKLPEDSVVGSSQPSSSSDTKKPASTEKRLDEQLLREAVHRSGLMAAKATSTPNHSTAAAVVTPSSSNPATPTPKTLNPVTTSAVSSSNVYSSTPIHPSFGKVSSGNVSKITNPPSSVETSRIEADDTTTTTTTTSSSSPSAAATSRNEQSASLADTETTEDKKAGDLTSSTKSLPSTTETATTGTSDSSAKSTKKELRHEDSGSSSKVSQKTVSDVSEVDSCTASGMNSTEEISLYVSNAGKVNGISSTSEGSDVDGKTDMTKSSLESIKREDDSKASVSVLQLDLSRAISPTTSVQQQYEVSVWYEGKELQFMSVERIHGGERAADPSVTAETVAHDASNIDSSSKQSSTTTTNGSVSSIGPFTLPGAQAAAAAATNVGQSSDSSSSSSVATVTGGAAKSSHSLTVPQMKQTVMGPKALCDLMIDEFKKLRRTFAPDEDVSDNEESAHGLLKTPKTPAVGGRGRKESAKKSASRGQKRSKAADSDDDEDDDDVRTPRASGSKQPAKRAKGTGGLAASSNESPVASSSSTTPKSKSVHQEPKQFDICCLARWTDRKYYAGRVTNYREDNKYVVVFEDGCSKTLSRDIIVFGEDGVLPIKHHSIHALTGGDTYEPAIVEEIKRNDANEVVYGVRTASSTLEVTATDIYLTDEQAKWIHNACKDKPDPIQMLRAQAAGTGGSAAGEDATGGNAGNAPEGNAAASELTAESGDKGARSTRSKRGANDKSMTPATPEAGYSGGVGKKGRRGRRKQLPPPEHISECSDVSDGYEEEEEVPVVTSPETGLDAVNGVQPELQRTEQESVLARMYIAYEYFGNDGKDSLDQLLGPIPVNAKTLFRNKHFLLSCTVPSKSTEANAKQFSNTPFVKQHIRHQIEAGGGKVYEFFEDVPKNKYKQCKLIAPRPSITAMYVQCLASDIVAVSHEWIIQCCQVLMLVDHKPYALPAGWSFLEKRFIDWGCGRAKDKRATATPFASVCINVASLCKDFNDFWSRVCKLAGGTVRLIKTESDITENLTGYLLTDQEFPEEIKIKATRNGLLVVSTVWVVQCLIMGRVCHPSSNEKLTQIYQEDDY
uniref:BRCT domain-containing protein n=2 Tax=Anopheles gambiae TaxID=7165 RepID=A0ABK8G691_ANOGA